MNIEVLFMIGVVMSFIASGTATKILIWPSLKAANREDALIALTVPHTFRFIGLSFLIPGVVSPTLSPAFSVPAAYGDLVSAILAVVVIWVISARVSWGIPMAWVFNLWGTVDLLHALYLGQIGVHVSPGSLGAAYFVPTVIVPALLISHGLIFWVLFRFKK